MAGGRRAAVKTGFYLQTNRSKSIKLTTDLHVRHHEIGLKNLLVRGFRSDDIIRWLEQNTT